MFIESSIIDLYDNSVEAFPKTTKRQYAIDPIKIVKFDWIPFVGVKTLFIKSYAKNESKEYNSIILIKNINYSENLKSNFFELNASNGKKYFLEKISINENDVLLRCNCPDFKWRFKHFNKLDKSLFGKDGKKYEAILRPGTANPKELSGMCKHLMKMVKVLKESYVFKEINKF
jgi:hypothetical protein